MARRPRGRTQKLPFPDRRIPRALWAANPDKPLRVAVRYSGMVFGSLRFIRPVEGSGEGGRQRNWGQGNERSNRNPGRGIGGRGMSEATPPPRSPPNSSAPIFSAAVPRWSHCRAAGKGGASAGLGTSGRWVDAGQEEVDAACERPGKNSFLTPHGGVVS